MLTSCYPAVSPLKLALPSKRYAHFFISLLFGLTISFPANAQLRQVYLDTQANNQVMKISFFSPSAGYIGFYNWVGFTTDSGRTYSRKYITLSNVNFGSYSNIDVTGGFDIQGVKAFSQDTIIVFGDYALVPSILYSTNGGNTFTLVFYSQFSPYQLSTGIMDMTFPVDHSTGFAVDADRILKTTNGGVTWTVADIAQGSFFNYLEALDNNNLFAFSNSNSPGTVLRTSDGGSTWQTPVLPAGQINYITFYTAGKLWVSMQNGSASNIYYSADAGADWTLKNPAAVPFSCIKMKFINDSTGYALKAGFTVYKTSDTGKVWELLQRDNNFTYLGYSLNDLCVASGGTSPAGSQFWVGGGHGFLELTANGGGQPLPLAVFTADTTNESVTDLVNLTSYSKPEYQYRWYVDGQLVGSAPAIAYTHNIYTASDTVELIVSNGVTADTAVQYLTFVALPYPAPVVSSFSPATGGTGTIVTIIGNFFKAVTGVSFGGVPASSYTVVSTTRIVATVGAGDNGYVTVTSAGGTGGLGGYLFSPPPTITSFSPLTGPVGTRVTISGTQFSPTAANNIVYFGSVRATVLAATPTQLTVQVPVSADYQPISVTVNHHLAYSGLPFIVTFPGTCGLSPYSFDPPVNATQLNAAYYMAKGDMDGDGKPDLITVQTDQLQIFRNTGGAGVISFANPVTYPTDEWSHELAIGDINGDGLPDIVMTNNDSNTVSIYANTSTPGNISFASPVILPTGGGPTSVAVGDLDGDGKADLVITNSGGNVNTFSIYRNIGVNGQVAFAPRVDQPDGILVFKVRIGDIDGDGKPDLLIVNNGYVTHGPGPDTPGYVIYRNTSTIGNISFAPKTPLPRYSNSPLDAALSDVDGDGRLDIAITSDIRYASPPYNQPISIYRNTSTPGNISFDSAINYPGASTYMASVVFDDLDGDGKPDLFSTGAIYAGLSLQKNTSVPGHISFTNISTGTMGDNLNLGSSQALTGDFDGIAKPELLTMANLASPVQVFRNRLGERGAWAGRDTTVCSGRTLTIGQPVLPVNVRYTYAWRSNPVGFQSTAAQAFITPTADTTYIVDVTDSTGCTTEDSITVKVGGPAPTETASPNRFICYGDSVQIGSSPTGTDTYSWTGLYTPFASTLSNPVVSPTSTNLYVDAINTGSCVVKDTVLVTVNYSPTANAGPDQNFCGNGSVTIGSTVVDYNTTFSWASYPAGFSSTQPSVQVQPSVTTTYVETASNGVCQSLDTVVVTVYPPLTADAGADRSICTGTTAVLGATAIQGYTYNWLSEPYGFSSQTANPPVTPAATTNYFLYVSNGVCTGRDTVTVTVNSNINTTANITASPDSTVCAGTTVVFTATPAPGVTNPAYQWLINGIRTGSDSSRFSVSGFADNTQVAVIVSTTDSCSAPVTSNTITLHVSALQDPAITITGDSIVTKGQAAVLTAVSSNAGPYPGYQWEDSTQTHGWIPIPGATAYQLKYTPVATGDEVHCIVYSSAVCSGQSKDTSAAIVFTVKATATTSSPGNSQPHLYPNPVINSLILDSLSLSDNWQSLTIESIDGRRVMVVDISNLTSLTLTAGGLSKGYYIAVLQKQSGGRTYLKFLKL
jgi:photosystem II stability/assembly factor-like uncharacterized protein